MSTIDFPNDPQVDDEYSFGTRTWKWTGEAWQLIASGLTGPTGPTGPAGTVIVDDDSLIIATQVFA
jgi:hypothetical protein